MIQWMYSVFSAPVFCVSGCRTNLTNEKGGVLTGMPIESDAVVLGKNIKRIRKSQHRTQEDVAFDAGISVKMLSEYENGKREMSSQVLFKIADALMVSVDELVPDRLKKPEEKANPEEDILLTMFRKMNTADREMLLGMAKRLGVSVA